MTADADRPGIFRIKRVYEPAEPTDGYRVLVDRLWPRGVSRERAALDDWCREAAPSTQLRRWYGHDPDRFDEFARRYRSELATPEAAGAVDELRGVADRRALSLVTATRDVEHSGAVVLRDVLVGGGAGGRSGS